MGKLTLWGGTKDFTEIINIEVGRVADATIKDNKATWDKAGNSLQQNTTYNGVKIDSTNGLLVTSAQNISTFNATKGIEIKKKTNNETVFSVDTSGNLVIKGSITMVGGSITWGSVNGPDYTQVVGTKPPADANNTWTTVTTDPKFTGLFYDASGKLKLVANAITATEIASNAVTTDKLYANSVTTAKINAEAVTATEIKTGTITAKQIQGKTITANEIQSGTITANEIQANAITAIKLNVTDIFADSVFVGKIKAVELNASKITSGYLSADRIQANTLNANVLKAGTLSFDQARGGTLRLGEDGGGDLVVYNGKDADGSLIPVGAINKNSAEFPNLTSPNIKGNVVNTLSVDTIYYVDNVNGNDNNNGLTRATAFRTVQAAINSVPKYLDKNVDIVMVSSGIDQVEDIFIRGFIGGGQLQLRSESGIKTLVGRVHVYGCSAFIRVVDFKINSRSDAAVFVDKCVSIVLVNLEINGNNVSYQGISIFNSRAEIINCAIYNVANDCIKAQLAAHIYVGDCKGGGANAMHGLTCIGAVVTGYGSAPTGRVSNWLRSYGGFLQEGSWWWDSGSAPPPIPPVTEQTVFIDSIGAASWRNNGDPRGWYSTVDAVQGTWNTYGPSYGIWWFGDRLEFLKGKTIIGMWVSVARNAGGWSAPDGCCIRTHGYRSRPGDSQPWMSGEFVRTPAMNKGDRIWVDVTSLGRKLTAENDRGGFGVQADGNGSTPFLRMDAWLQVKVTYK